MTAPVLVESSRELTIQLPLAHQVPMMDSTARWKVRQAGRREGKTTIDFVSSVVGHGPGWREGKPHFPGIAQGGDVVWIGKDYNQAKAIWEGDIEPRFRGLDGVKLNITDRTVKLEGGGTLHIRSGERKPVAGIRGLGKRVVGIICDEAAHWDLRWAWRNVLRPVLMDNVGWCIFTSTTNKGNDGGRDPETGNVVVPSYFNTLCQHIIDGAPGRTRAEGWERFYGTAADNPKIDPQEFKDLLSEYVAGSLEEAQEVYAKLLTGGAGLAFHEWRDDLHKVAYDVPTGWRWFGGLDWGYRNPYALLFLAVGPDGDILVRHEMYGKVQTAFEVGYLAGQRARGFPGRLEWIAGDSAMWAVTGNGPSVAEEFARGLSAATEPEPIPLISAPKGPGSRTARVQLLHEALRYETLPAGARLPGGLLATGNEPAPWAGPKLRIHKDCVNSLRTIPALPIDPNHTEDVDTEAEDHAYDALTYALQARVPQVERVTYERVPDDVHPGYDYSGKGVRRRPRWDREPDQEEQRLQVLREGRFLTGVRVGLARPSGE